MWHALPACSWSGLGDLGTTGTSVKNHQVHGMEATQTVGGHSEVRIYEPLGGESPEIIGKI